MFFTSVLWARSGRRGWAKKVEGSIAFISELILLRKPKLKHLSVSQIKRFSSRLQLIDWIGDRILKLDQSSQFAREWPDLALYFKFFSPLVSILILFQTGQGQGKGWEVMAWKDQPLSNGGNNGAMGATTFEQWPLGGNGGHPGWSRAMHEMLCNKIWQSLS